MMEALALEKPLVVAVNAALMDDHQQELARAMEEQVNGGWTVQRLADKHPTASTCLCAVRPAFYSGPNHLNDRLTQNRVTWWPWTQTTWSRHCKQENTSGSRFVRHRLQGSYRRC